MFLHCLDVSALPLAAAVINFPESIGFTEVLLETLTETHGNDVSTQPIGEIIPATIKRNRNSVPLAERENQNCPLHFRQGEEEKKEGGMRSNYKCLEIPSA